jgi:hypothetical protein
MHLVHLNKLHRGSSSHALSYQGRKFYNNDNLSESYKTLTLLEYFVLFKIDPTRTLSRPTLSVVS